MIRIPVARRWTTGAVWPSPLGLPMVASILVVSAVWTGFNYPVSSTLRTISLALLFMGAILAVLWNGRAPALGFGLLLLSAVLAPFGGRQWNAPLPIAAVLCALSAAQPVLWRRQLGLELSAMTAATLMFMAIPLLSFAVGQFAWFPIDPAPLRAQVGGLAVFVVSGGLVLVVGHQLRSIAQLERLTWLFIGASTVVVVLELVSRWAGRTAIYELVEPRSVGSLFWVWFVALTTSQALFNPQLRRASRILLLAAGALGLGRGVFLALSWASGWIPSLVAVGVIVLVRFPRLAIGAGVLLIAPVAFFIANLIAALMENESYSWSTRLEAWTTVLQIVEKSPWLGFGPANYHHYTILFPIRGWWVRFNSHSNYVDLVAQTGIIGLCAFVWFVFEAVRVAIRVFTRCKPGFARAYGLGVLAGLAGSVAAGFLGDWIVPFVYNVGVQGFRSSLLFWFFVGGAVALARLGVPSRPFLTPRQVLPAVAPNAL